ncbi:MAG TPA: FCD domain-containing protein [Acidimicrobiales bacterium]|nr:FCD domain-containing protein [Acidimicrobiales bacterium]
MINVGPTSRIISIDAMPASPDEEEAVAQVPKAAQLIARQLRGAILRGELPIGEPLASPPEMMKRFGVSLPTLRAALHILETEALVEMRRGSRGGTIVRAPSVDVTAQRAGAFLQYHRATVDDVHRARILIEPPAVAVLAERRDPDDIAALKQTVVDQSAAIEDSELVRAIGERFHSQIVELAGNQTVIVFSAMLDEIIDRHTARSQVDRAQRGGERQTPKMLAEHEKALALIEAGDSVEAERFWRAHLEHVRQVTVSRTDTTVLDLMS